MLFVGFALLQTMSFGLDFPVLLEHSTAAAETVQTAVSTERPVVPKGFPHLATVHCSAQTACEVYQQTGNSHAVVIDRVHCLGLQVTKPTGHETRYKTAGNVLETATQRLVEVPHSLL